MKRLLRLTIYNASHMADLQKYVEKVRQMYFYKYDFFPFARTKHMLTQ